jgi:predicted transposase YbfD/YdcC
MRSTLIEHFSILPDPRRTNHHALRHSLTDIVIITILATVGGADTWVDIESFGKEKEAWLKQFLMLKNGIPSHDTLARVFSILDPKEFQSCFSAWVQDVIIKTKGEVIAIDGKTARRARKTKSKPLHIVSAFATINGVTLGQIPVAEKSNEITAIPKLLDKLFLKGCIVTTDAMGCQGWIVRKIIENKGDYALAVKSNQKRLLDDIQKTFNTKAMIEFDYVETSEKAHGRHEKRECWSTNDLSCIRDTSRWDALASISKVIDTRTINKKTTTATRYFISSLKNDSKEILRVVREHWKIENSLHWTLDIAFREDESRTRTGHSQKNLTVVRKIALNLLKNEKSMKNGIKAKRFRACLSNDYLLKVLGISNGV